METRPTVRIDDPGDLVAGLPHLLGYRPRESVVLIALGGESGRRVGLTARADLPPAGHGRELAASLARRLATDGAQRALAVVVSEDPDEPGWSGVGLPHRELVHDVVLALDDVGLSLEQALLARGGRWWDFDCAQPCCAPGAGTALPGGTGAIAAASVAAGMVVAADRAELEQRLTPSLPVARAAAEQACARIMAEFAARPHERTGPAADERILRAVRRFRPGPVRERLDDDELARIVCSLSDVPVRDRALRLCLGAEAPAAEALWTECVRRAPAPLDAAPATLLAVTAWLRGDGAMANIALDRALAGDPGYHLAGVLADALTACVPPSRLRAFLVESLLAEAGREPDLGRW
ncbi:DUF4192 domain-containing protein [Blastococcus sp. CCUG 61487]|uniref:DUF4192 domain-containing protein n=1 Tax=Blastococcus sp. CCUG 61487 TaxID=1840703 RepID=UPI0010BFE47E|nr:DUF4192 domain-containing protein [Blastococcus sp. CCUG 61487]TKJ28870.1 hypothetical protein A6V29_02490 [Blastococcus sp. CCUG 61487]